MFMSQDFQKLLRQQLLISSPLRWPGNVSPAYCDFAFSQDFRAEIERNQEESFEDLGLSAGDNGLYINGLSIDLDTTDVYSLLELLKKEEKLAAGFFRMGYRREYLSLLSA